MIISQGQYIALESEIKCGCEEGTRQSDSIGDLEYCWDQKIYRMPFKLVSEKHLRLHKNKMKV